MEAKRSLKKSKQASKQLMGCEELLEKLAAFCKSPRKVRILRVKLFKTLDERESTGAILMGRMAYGLSPIRPHGKSIYLREGQYCFEEIVKYADIKVV